MSTFEEKSLNKIQTEIKSVNNNKFYYLYMQSRYLIRINDLAAAVRGIPKLLQSLCFKKVRWCYLKRTFSRSYLL